MGDQENVKQLEERSVLEKLKLSLVYPRFSLVLALLGIPLATKMQPLTPILTFATGGALLDVSIHKEREQAKRVCAGAQAQMGGQKNAKQLEERSLKEKLNTDWVCSVSGAILSFPLAMHTRSLVPIYGFAMLGAMLDVIDREDAERERKLRDPK